MENEQLNKIRFNKLKAERLLEIKREGVQVDYFYGGMGQRSFFEFAFMQAKKLGELITQKKFPLEVCDVNGQPIIKFLTSDVYTEPQQYGKLFIGEKRKFHRLQNGQKYYLAKRNPSNSVYKSIYSTNGQVYERNELSFSDCIREYIEQNIQEVNVEVPIIFEQQTDLNEMQNKAIAMVGRNALTFIKGPPGCGKTKIIARLCRLLLEQDQRVILGAVSNTGNISILRQFLTEITCYNNHSEIEELMKHVDLGTVGVEDMLVGANSALSPLKLVYFTPLQSWEENRALDPLIRYYSLNHYLIRNILEVNLHGDLSMHEIAYNIECIVKKMQVSNKFYSLYMQAFAKTFREAHIVVATTVASASINDRLSNGDEFYPDVAILDEAAQASWADTFCYLKFNVQRLVLVGDENQLDPTVISQEKVLKETVFNKLSRKKPEYFVLLDTQYRMHPEIAEFPNCCFYEGQIKNGVTAEDRATLVPHFSVHPLSFIAHSYPENEYIQMDKAGKGKKNYYNLGEVAIIQQILSYFSKEELSNVGIITPYSLQLKSIAETFKEQVQNYGLTVRTCDGYQGGQKDFIIVSCVRSNIQGKIGFCGERNRTNVTLTRARRGLAIIGNMYTLSIGSEYQEGQNVWASLIQYLAYKNKIIAYQPPADQLILNEDSLAIQHKQEHAVHFDVKRTYAVQELINLLIQKQKQLQEEEEEDQMEELLSKNKKQVKQMRRMPPFASISTQYDPSDSLTKVEELFDELETDLTAICLRMTKKVIGQLVQYLQQTEQLMMPNNALLQLFSSLDATIQQVNHLTLTLNLYTTVKLILFKRACSATP